MFGDTSWLNMQEVSPEQMEALSDAVRQRLGLGAESQLVYERDGTHIHCRFDGLTNHEMRMILVGFWLTMDKDDRRDFVKELTHYLEPGSTPPLISRAILFGFGHQQTNEAPT